MKHFLLSFSLLSGLNSFAQSFYDLSTIQTIEIYFNQSNWDAILDAAEPSGSYTMADSIIINGTTYDSVGVKYKGNSSYNANQAKNPFHIELDTYKNQDYQGYTDIKLSNVAKDPSFLREVLSYKILRQYMHAPESNFANVYVNGTLIGLYSNDEAISKKFVNNHFYSKTNAFFNCSPPNGAGPSATDLPDLVYYGNDSTDYYLKYEIKSDFGWAEIVGLTDTIANNFSAIENILDEDRALWMLAFDNVFVNLDSYMGQFKQNYYLYQDDEGIFNPVVWDLNESFGGFAATGSGNLTNTTSKQQMSHLIHQNDANWPLIQKMFNDPTYKRMYVAHMRTILEENIGNNSYYTDGQTLQALISTSVQNDVNKFFSFANFTSNLTNDVSSGPQSYSGLTNLMNGRYTYLMGLSDFTAIPPTISNINSSSANPALNSTVTITADITNTNSVFLGYRYDETKHFQKITMYDDGAHNDGASGDGTYGADLPVNASFIQYYIYAENNNAGMFSPERAEHEFYTLLATVPVISAGDVVINELMAVNTSTVADGQGDYDDWIELYNTTSNYLDLSNLYLSDLIASPLQWEIPANTIIAPNDYLIIWADNDTTDSGLHANFKLSSGGEDLILSYANGTVIDQVTFPIQSDAITYGRYVNGTGSFTYLYPTYTTENALLGIEDYSNENHFNLFPNPTNGILNISTENVNLHSIAVFDLSGKMIFNESNINQMNHQINLSDYPIGMYLLLINDTESYKLTIQK